MNTNALDVQRFIRGDSYLPQVESKDYAADRKVELDRFLIMASISIIAFLLLSVLNPYHFVLTAAYGWAGLWATDRLSRKSAMAVAPILIVLNLGCWSQSFIALPLAALTIGLAADFPIDECSRDALRLSGLTCAALTLLCMLA